MEFFERYKKLIITAVIILCFIIAIITVDRAKPTFFESSIGYVLTPIQKINTNTASWINKKIQFFKNLNEIENENNTLKEQLIEKETELNRLKLIEAENEQLSALVNVALKYSSYPTIGARIIAKDPGNWYDIFIIDKGSKDGLEKNMVVMASGGLVGRIKECGYNYSKVVSVIDSSDAVSAKSLRTDDVGFLRGDISNPGFCLMEYIDNDAEIIEGDEIVTSHLSNIFPPGITIGYVKEITTDVNALTKRAIIEPTVDFKHLETILVINKVYDKKLIENPIDETTTIISEE